MDVMQSAPEGSQLPSIELTSSADQNEQRPPQPPTPPPPPLLLPSATDEIEEVIKDTLEETIHEFEQQTIAEREMSVDCDQLVTSPVSKQEEQIATVEIVENDSKQKDPESIEKCDSNQGNTLISREDIPESSVANNGVELEKNCSSPAIQDSSEVATTDKEAEESTESSAPHFRQIFKEVKFAICEDIEHLERVKKELINNGAKFLHYLSDSATHLIADNGEHSSVSEAVDIYEKPVVSSQWVWLSLRAQKVLPIKPFCPIKCDQLFAEVVACSSQLASQDRQRIWSMVTYYGGRFEVALDTSCTHLITTTIRGAKYDWASRTGQVKVVSPDWLVDCIRQKCLCPEDRYHPKLLVTYNKHLSATTTVASKSSEPSAKIEPVEKKSIKSVTMSISTESVTRKTELINESLLEEARSEVASAPTVPSSFAHSTTTTTSHQSKMIHSINYQFSNQQQQQQQRQINSAQTVQIKGSKIVSGSHASLSNSAILTNIAPPVNKVSQESPTPTSSVPTVSMNVQQQHQQQQHSLPPQQMSYSQYPGTQQQQQQNVMISSGHHQQQMQQHQYSPNQTMQQSHQMNAQPRQVYLTVQQQQQQQMFNNNNGQYRQFVPRPQGAQPNNMIQIQQRAMTRPPLKSNQQGQPVQQQQQIFRHQVMRTMSPQQQQQYSQRAQNMATQGQLVNNQIYMKQQQQQANMMQQRAAIKPMGQRVSQPSSVQQQQQQHMAPNQAAMNHFQMAHQGQHPMPQDSTGHRMQLIRIAVPPSEQQKMSQQSNQLPPNYPQQQQQQAMSPGVPQMVRPMGQMVQVNNNGQMQTRMLMRPGMPVQAYQMAQQQPQQQQQQQPGQTQLLIRGQMAGPSPNNQQQLPPQQMQYIRQPQQANQPRWANNVDYNNQPQQQQQYVHVTHVNQGVPQSPQQRQQIWLQQQQARRFPMQPASQMVRIQRPGPNGGMQHTILPSASSTLANLSAMQQHEQKVRANVSVDQSVVMIANNENNNGGSVVASGNQAMVATTGSTTGGGLVPQQQQVQVNLPAAKTILVSAGTTTTATTGNNYQVSFIPTTVNTPLSNQMSSSNSNSPSPNNAASGSSVVNEKTKTALANLLNNRLNMQQQNNGQPAPSPQPQVASNTPPLRPQLDNCGPPPPGGKPGVVCAPGATVRIPHLVTVSSNTNNLGGNSMTAHHMVSAQHHPMQHHMPETASPIADLSMSTIHHAPVPSQAMSNTTAVAASTIPYSYSQLHNRAPLPNPSMVASAHPMVPQHHHPAATAPPPPPPAAYANANVNPLVLPPNQSHPMLQHPYQRSVQIRFYGQEGGDIPPDKCFIGCVFYIAPSYTENSSISSLIPGWRRKIEKFGGRFVEQYISGPNSDITHVVTEHMQGPLPKQALQDNIRCVTIFWLDDVLANQRLLPPWRFYHLPVAYNHNKPCRNHIVTISNFHGEERNKIAKLIELTGAKFTNYLSSKNTILICKRLHGKKYEKALEWRIAIVNLQWLHDVLFGHLDPLQLASLSKKYQTFDNSLTTSNSADMPPSQMLRRDLFRLDYSVVSPLMNPWKTPIKWNDTSLPKTPPENFMKKENDVEQKQNSETDSKEPNESSKRSFAEMNGEESANGSEEDGQSAKRQKIENEISAESDTPVLQANDVAMEESSKMDITEVSLLAEKESAECCSNSSNGSQAIVVKGEENSVSSATENSAEDNNSQFKVPLVNGNRSVSILFTGIPMKERKVLTSQIESLGGKVVNEPTDCTHLVLDNFVSTSNFFAAFSRAQFLVNSKWIRDSFKAGKFAEEEEYPVKDEEAELLYNINLQLSISKRNANLFCDQVFFITPSCTPSRLVLKKFIELNGGIAELTRLPNRRQLEKMRRNKIRFVVVSCENDIHTCDYFFDNHIDVVSKDFVLNAILRQKLDYDYYSLPPKKS